LIEAWVGDQLLLHCSALGQSPAAALRRVFQQDAFIGQLLADGIGTGEVAGGRP
jgi:hypothetical protein